MAKTDVSNARRTQPPPLGADRANVAAAGARGSAPRSYMEEHGHVVTGMSNQIVWGMPHVFAVFLIVSASGALNVASISSVFNRLAYKPYARLSGILAVSLLAGGLMVLVLDLGWPDARVRCDDAQQFQVDLRLEHLSLHRLRADRRGLSFHHDGPARCRGRRRSARRVGWIAFVWRLVLTTGTGSIFGFLVAREAYDAAIMAPLFIAASFLYGLSFTVIGARDHEPRDPGRADGRRDDRQVSRAFDHFRLRVLFFTAVAAPDEILFGLASRRRAVPAARRRRLSARVLARSDRRRLARAACAPPVFAVRREKAAGDHDRLDPVPDRRPLPDLRHHHRRSGLSARHLPGDAGRRVRSSTARSPATFPRCRRRCSGSAAFRWPCYWSRWRSEYCRSCPSARRAHL